MEKRVMLIALAILLLSFARVNGEASQNESSDASQNSTAVLSTSIQIVSFFPTSFAAGDKQLNIQVQNNGNETLYYLSAIISGEGFSSYDITPIDFLEPGDKSYILVSGNFEEAGKIELRIIIEGQVFYQNVSVTDSNSINETEQEQIAREKQELLANLSLQLNEVEINYNSLEIILAEKKNEDYDVSQISLADLKAYIRNTESSILAENANAAKINLKMAQEEYAYQKNKIDNAPETSAVSRLKNYALIFTTIAGAFIMIFTLIELLKKKGAHVVSTISSVKEKISVKKNKSG